MAEAQQSSWRVVSDLNYALLWEDGTSFEVVDVGVAVRAYIASVGIHQIVAVFDITSLQTVRHEALILTLLLNAHSKTNVVLDFAQLHLPHVDAVEFVTENLFSENTNDNRSSAEHHFYMFALGFALAHHHVLVFEGAAPLHVC